MTDNARKAGSGDKPGPAREQVVIRDKRKIDATGRAKNGAEPPSTGSPGASEATGHTGAPANAGTTTASAEGGKAGGATEPAATAQPGTPAADERGNVSGAGDPTTTATAEPSAAGGQGAGAAAEAVEPATAGKGLGAELEALRGELDERTRDLQRVTAEYANYRKRVERDRALVGEQAVGSVISALLPILDDLDRAREHGDLVGPFAAVAEQLTAALAKFGLTGFGEQGDAFDPTRHEAVAHQTSAEVTEPTCVSVMRRGYLLGERLLRPAMVAVADPE